MQLITGSYGGERCINMAVTLREIIKQVQHLEMKLVAGETGLDPMLPVTGEDMQQRSVVQMGSYTL